MQSITFEAEKVDGVIVIPDHLAGQEPSSIDVIFHFAPKGEGPPVKKSDLILAPTYSTKGWKFCREEANARR